MTGPTSDCKMAALESSRLSSSAYLAWEKGKDVETPNSCCRVLHDWKPSKPSSKSGAVAWCLHTKPQRLGGLWLLQSWLKAWGPYVSDVENPINWNLFANKLWSTFWPTKSLYYLFNFIYLCIFSILSFSSFTFYGLVDFMYVSIVELKSQGYPTFETSRMDTFETASPSDVARRIQTIPQEDTMTSWCLHQFLHPQNPAHPFRPCFFEVPSAKRSLFHCSMFTWEALVITDSPWKLWNFFAVQASMSGIGPGAPDLNQIRPPYQPLRSAKTVYNTNPCHQKVIT